MNRLFLKTIVVPAGKQLIIDGIEFTNSILLELNINDFSCRKVEHLDSALVVFPELMRSLSGSGRYLIFTSASGIADEGGWEGVDVKFERNIVTWNFEIEDIHYGFSFDEIEYEMEIRKIEQELKILTKTFELEPSAVFFPESWEQ